MSTARPSTSERAPMAFTCEDVGRGAFAAWTTFMAILLAVIATSGLLGRADLPMTLVGLGYVAIIGGVISAIVTVLLSPIAWLLGSLLRSIRQLSVHVVAFALLGAGTGAGVLLLSGTDLVAMIFAGWAWPVIVATTISVVAGWAWAVRHARRYHADPATDRRALTRTDDDAAFEDHALED